MSTRGAIGADSCRKGADNRDGPLGLLAAFNAMSALQSRSVLGNRGDSAGVRGEGELGREPVKEPCRETVGELSTLRS